MDRRTFLRRALSLAPALVALPPAVSYFLPPRGGWPSITEIINNRLRQAGPPDYMLSNNAMFELILKRIRESEQSVVDSIARTVYFANPYDWAEGRAGLAQHHSGLARALSDEAPPEAEQIREYSLYGVPVVVSQNLAPGEFVMGPPETRIFPPRGHIERG